MAVSISGVSGTLTHGNSVTISGSGFGAKATAAPDTWDDCSGSDPAVLWDGYWPDQDPDFNIDYRAAQRSIPMPHSRISKYLCGCHYDNGGANAGFNVIFWKDYTYSSGDVLYFNWKERIDDNWSFGLGSPADDNFKTFDYSHGTEPFELDSGVGANWYIEYNPRPTSTSSGCTWHIVDDDNDSDPNPYNLEFDCTPFGGGSTCDANGHSWFWNAGVNPMSGVWRNMELEIRLTSWPDDSTGYIKLWENGTLKIDYLGHTDGMDDTTRVVGLGGYARSQGSSNNWRYFADIYYDTTRSRVVLGNADTYTGCTRREPQIPTSWAAGSIAVNMQLGSFGNTDTAWVYVMDSAGAVNANGFEVTLGSGAAGEHPPKLTLAWD